MWINGTSLPGTASIWVYKFIFVTLNLKSFTINLVIIAGIQLAKHDSKYKGLLRASLRKFLSIDCNI